MLIMVAGGSSGVQMMEYVAQVTGFQLFLSSHTWALAIAVLFFTAGRNASFSRLKIIGSMGARLFVLTAMDDSQTRIHR